MKSYEINMLCDREGCTSYETSEPAGLHDAEQQIEASCTDEGWDIHGEIAICPDCIAAGGVKG